MLKFKIHMSILVILKLLKLQSSLSSLKDCYFDVCSKMLDSKFSYIKQPHNAGFLFMLIGCWVRVNNFGEIGLWWTWMWCNIFFADGGSE